MRFAFAMISAVLLGACATIPEDQCAKTDWYELGLKDGRAGHSAERLVQHREVCAGVKVEPDELRYLQGRKVGINEYCEPENAFRDGMAGHEYRGVCDAAFARNHQAAYRVASLRKSIESNRGDVSWRESEIRSDKTSDSRRSQLRSEVRELDRKYYAMRDEIVFAERDLDRLRVAQAPAPVVAIVPAPAPPPAAKPAAVPVGKAGTASGRLVIGKDELALRFSYTFVAPDPLDQLRKRPMLLLTEQAIPSARLGEAADLDRVLGALPHYVLVIRNEAKPPRVAMVVWHPKLGSTPAVEMDAGKGGTAKFDAYGAQRIAGSIASPQNGKSAFAWNKAIKLEVRFDAPLARRWPP